MMRTSLAALVALFLGSAACGGKSPAGPGTPPPPGGSTLTCRTYSAAETRIFSSTAGITGSVMRKCQYDRSTNEFKCSADYLDSRPLAYAVNTVAAYASLADFVGEVERISIVGRALTLTATIPTPGFAQTVKSTYSYDGQGRATQISNRYDNGSVTLQTFTAWDTFGRPTASNLDGRETLVYAYNDTERFFTIANTRSGGLITETFDANGIQIKEVAVNSGVTETHTWTIHSTATVCR